MRVGYIRTIHRFNFRKSSDLKGEENRRGHKDKSESVDLGNHLTPGNYDGPRHVRGLHTERRSAGIEGGESRKQVQ